MARQASGAVLGVPPLDRSSAAEGAIDITSPEFATHFGSLLAETRRRDHRSIRDVAAANGGEFGPRRLRRLERGSAPLDDSVIEAACRQYRADLGTILPSRMAMTIENHVMIAGGVRVTFERDDPTSVLSGYLRLIRSMRDQKKAPAITLRRDDIERLADYLELDGAQVIDRLASLMGATAAQRVAIGSLFAAGAIVVGLVAAGHADAGATAPVPPAAASLVGTASVSVSVGDTTPLASDSAVATARQSVSIAVAAGAVAVRTQVSDAVETSPPPTVTPISTSVRTTITEISGATDTAELAPAVRVEAPVAATPETTTPTAVENRSGCNIDPGGAVMSLAIADISYDCPVYAGGQPLIDAGYVTLVTDAGESSVLATAPGDPGTLWLAGHRTTHGAAFAEVPDLADGALITVANGDTTATYQVIGRAHVEVRADRVVDADGNATAQATWESIIRTDLGGDLAPRLVLQTCDGSDFRWMIYADLVTA